MFCAIWRTQTHADGLQRLQSMLDFGRISDVVAYWRRRQKMTCARSKRVGHRVIFLFFSSREISTQTGTVKWFDASKGFGFVIPESGGADIYVHLKVLQKAGLETVEAGTAVKFSVARRGDKQFLDEIEVVAAPKPAPVRARTPQKTVGGALNDEDAFEREWGLRRG